MLKKYLTLFLALVMCFSLLTACASKDKGKEDPTKEVKEESTEKEKEEATEAKEEPEKEEKEDATEEEKAEESDEDKTLVVATTSGFFPIVYEDDDGNLTGFEYDIIVDAAERAGYEIEFKLTGDYAAMFEGVKSGNFDTMIGQISVTEEREKNYTFTDVYGYNAIKMCVRGDDPAKTVEDLQGRKVCIEFGTVLEDIMNDINADFPEDKQIELVITEGNIYEELKIGHYDAFPITVLSFDQVNAKGEYEFKLIGDPVLVDRNAFPFAKEGNEAKVEAINKALKEMREDGTLSEISKKYFDRDITQEEITE